jgi:hypothetical protein
MKILRAFLSLSLGLSFATFQMPVYAAAGNRPTKLPEKKKRSRPTIKSAAPAAAVKKPENKSEIVPLPEKKPTQKTASVPAGRITQLPAFKAKRRTYSPPASGVVIRSMSADEYQTYAATADAEAKATALVQTKLVAKPLPIETMQIDDLESQVIDEISDAPRPAVAEAIVPPTTVTTLPPLAPSVVMIADSDESLRQEMAVKETAAAPSLEPTPAVAPVVVVEALVESASAPIAEPVASSADAAPAPAVTAPVPTPAPTPLIVPAPQPTPIPEEDLAKTESLASDLELRPARVQHLRLHVAYLDARYGNIQSDLENGSSTFGLSYGRDIDFIEARLGVDFIHGLDQKVELDDTRTVLARVDAVYSFLKRGFFSPYISSGLGYAVSNVRSYRSQADGSTLVRDHLESKSFAFIPGGGARLHLASQLDLDLGVEYLGLFGGQNASSLGGLSVGGSIGFTF